MNQGLKFNLFAVTLYTCFGRSFRPSSGVQDCTYSNRHMSNRYCWLLASIPTSKQSAVSTLHVSDSLSVYHQEFKTVHTATRICQADTANCLLASKQLAVSVWHMRVAVCTVLNSWGWKERPPETCSVTPHKINLKTLVHLVGFTIETCMNDIQRYPLSHKEYVTHETYCNCFCWVY